MKPFHRLVPGILEKIPVLIYAVRGLQRLRDVRLINTQGDADFICNWLGNQAWAEALDWPGKKAYNDAKLHDLTLSAAYDEHAAGTKTGQVKSAANFTYIRIHAAGHMVPLDQPEASLDMLNRWLDGEWFAK